MPNKKPDIIKYIYIINWLEFVRDSAKPVLYTLCVPVKEREYMALYRDKEFRRHDIRLEYCCLGLILLNNKVLDMYEGIDDEMAKSLGWTKYYNKFFGGN